MPEHRTALYVDFDNIYLGLRTLDPAAAEAFASRPAQWIEWLEAGGGGRPASPRRRFLVRTVYLNPVAFGNFRAVFTRSGFRAVDCPPLTGQGKNSADIYMVLDIMDALSNDTRYDEFVILSADADFTPVLHRLRSQDRRTTVVTAGLTAAAYRATCDTFVTAEQLVAAALGDAVDPDDPSLESAPAIAVAPSSQARETATERAEAEPAYDIAAVKEAIRDAVRLAEKPLTSAAAAQAALKVDPAIKDSDWYGAGSFRAFLALYLDDLSYEAAPPGYVFDPARHSAADIQRPDRVDLGQFL
ncbi:NYN domain-containing protein [Geodermatophilus sp. SYSU D01180]